MTPTGPAPAPIRIYGALADLVAPLAYQKVTAKLSRLGTAPERLPERCGKPTAPRPDGPLIWCHAASVGESLSMLPLITQMGRLRDDLNFLMTSGTQTSADILSKRLPERTRHQFAPLDARTYVRRFLDHWSPDAAIFVESELWPNMIQQTRARDVPMALVNARISDRSVRNWKRFQQSAGYLLHHFEMIHCQDDRTEMHLRDLGIGHAKRGVNLKSLAEPLPYDAGMLEALRQTTKDRRVWLAASTHPGEDEVVLAAHRTLLETYPDALLILVPRHPERAEAIKALIAEAGLSMKQRSAGDGPEPQVSVYLADTLGEMGLWYTLCPLTVLCGSFSDVGGHNPYEPAQAGSFVLHGPRFANFAHAYHELDAAGAGQSVADAAEIAAALKHGLASPAALQDKQVAARNFVSQQGEAKEILAGDLFKALGLS
ncbi:MAG: 3-deoxy-D-manno-octulosonic acid transferase [Pseudomonadota bacterium]